MIPISLTAFPLWKCIQTQETEQFMQLNLQGEGATMPKAIICNSILKIFINHRWSSNYLQYRTGNTCKLEVIQKVIKAVDRFFTKCSFWRPVYYLQKENHPIARFGMLLQRQPSGVFACTDSNLKVTTHFPKQYRFAYNAIYYPIQIFLFSLNAKRE